MNSTVTSSPGAAMPQIGTGRSCWSTMLSPKTEATLNSALAGVGTMSRSHRAAVKQYLLRMRRPS